MLKIHHLLQLTATIAIVGGYYTTVITPMQANPVNPGNSGETTRYRRNNIALGTKIETVSGTAEIALAKHLAANDVKFYGAYWCSHCQKQKSLFGAAASSHLLYIECAADGENSQRQLCKDKNIQMFPTWVIKGQYFTGVRELKEIALLTNYKGSMNFKYHK